MIATWMLYLTAVSLLLALAAQVLERVFSLRGWPLRGLWVGALTGSVLLPPAVALASLRTTASDIGGAAQIGGVQIIAVSPAPVSSVASTLSRHLPALDGPLLVGWGLASAMLLLFLLASAVRLHERRRSWRPVRMGEREVLLSRDTGPAVVGLVRSRVVLPEWVLGLDPTRQNLLMAHEEEHLRAGDPRLLLLALGVLVLAPWNLALWWQARRLRLAIEVDCDARVLRRAPSLRTYGSLLLEVGARRSRSPVLVTAFSEPTSFLERRLLMITQRTSHRSPPSLFLGLALASALVLVACDLDQPESATEALTGARSESAPGLPALAQEPTFTPYTAKPELLNREEVGRLLKQAYPPMLRETGIGGTAVLWVFVDEQGQVQNTRVTKSAGEPALDRAAEVVMRQMRFQPAENDGQVVSVWIQLPVTFQAH
jgi:bla regulator protein BlaR1